MFGLSPWLLMGSLLAMISVGAGAYFKGDADAANRYQVKIEKMQLDAQKQVQKVRDQLTAQANSAVASLETKNAAARAVYRTITEQVDKVIEMPVYRNTCFDEPGLQLANAALGGVATAATTVSGAASGMPNALATH